ncbi:PREDICTED: uncharacterized protein LOC107353289 isoform X2 [Acropora digitifera]|uniref:uncharacterized protein LOC107353289 isoform X2 n=1 Tax=Acropora digitifera TaxID=70779 RepID=UPI00077A2AF7|nr:PREDICTED: uncharacterized protein LOC107353289 isoform X2 [Acropora digitifera]
MTLAAALDISSRRTLPFFWDDASDFSVLEKVAVSAFNNSKKKTLSTQKSVLPRTAPIVTMNPQAIKKTTKSKNEKLGRVFSRIAVVPFNRIEAEQSLENSLNLQMELQPLLETAVRSIGIILKLGDAFTTMRTDPVFQEVLTMSEQFYGLDLRAKFNYVLLMFSTGKILEMLNLKDEYFPLVKLWMVDAVIPYHKQIMELGHTRELNVKSGMSHSVSMQDEIEMRALIQDIAVQASTNPDKVMSFFKPNISARKCSCGEAFAFKVGEMLQFINRGGQQDALRAFIKSQGIGCNGIKLVFKGTQCHGSHIRRRAIPEDCLKRLDEAFQKKVPMSVSKSKEGGSAVAEEKDIGQVDAKEVEVAIIDTAPQESGVPRSKEGTSIVFEDAEDSSALDEQELEVAIIDTAPQESGVPKSKEGGSVAYEEEEDSSALDAKDGNAASPTLRDAGVSMSKQGKSTIAEEEGDVAIIGITPHEPKVLENPRQKNQATKRKQRTDKLQDGLTPKEVVSGKRARKTTKK